MSHANLELAVQIGANTLQAQLRVEQAVIAGWTGRDKAAVEKHIRELEELGVPRPASTPIYYRVSATRLTTAGRIQVCGTDTSGEVEFVLARINGKLCVGVGSDHTDRRLETTSVTLSKQACDKPVASNFWVLEDVAGHWDRIEMRSWIPEGGGRRLYQEGSVAAMLSPSELVSGWPDGAGSLPDACMMFCGTFAVIGGIRAAPRFEFELHDPVLDRSIRHAYDIESLPVLG